MIASQFLCTSKSVDLLGSGLALELLFLWSIFTHYAGNSSTFKAVATTAHWAIEGYISDIEASPVYRIYFWCCSHVAAPWLTSCRRQLQYLPPKLRALTPTCPTCGVPERPCPCRHDRNKESCQLHSSYPAVDNTTVIYI